MLLHALNHHLMDANTGNIQRISLVLLLDLSIFVEYGKAMVYILDTVHR